MTEKQFNFLFNQAKKLMQKSGDAVHDWSHCKRVIDNALKIKNLLFQIDTPLKGLRKLDDKILILAGAWHDMSFAFYKPGLINFLIEGQRTGKIIKKYFKLAKISDKEIDLIKSIARYHTYSNFHRLNRKRSLYHQIIQDADTLESFVSPFRIQQVEKRAKKSLWYKFIIKIMKPLFFDFLNRHPKFIYNLPQIIKSLEH